MIPFHQHFSGLFLDFTYSIKFPSQNFFLKWCCRGRAFIQQPNSEKFWQLQNWQLPAFLVAAGGNDMVVSHAPFCWGKIIPSYTLGTLKCWQFCGTPQIKPSLSTFFWTNRRSRQDDQKPFLIWKKCSSYLHWMLKNAHYNTVWKSIALWVNSWSKN